MGIEVRSDNPHQAMRPAEAPERGGEPTGQWPGDGQRGETLGKEDHPPTGALVGGAAQGRRVAGRNRLAKKYLGARVKHIGRAGLAHIATAVHQGRRTQHGQQRRVVVGMPVGRAAVAARRLLAVGVVQHGPPALV